MGGAEYTPQILLLLGVGFLVANVRIGVDALEFLRRRSSALLTWRGPQAPLLRPAARARRDPRCAPALTSTTSFGPASTGPAAGVRHRHDVPLLRLSGAAEPAHRPRLLHRRHLVGERLRPVLEDWRGVVAGGRRDCAGHRLPAEKSGPAAGRAGRTLRRRHDGCCATRSRPTTSSCCTRAWSWARTTNATTSRCDRAVVGFVGRCGAASCARPRIAVGWPARRWVPESHSSADRKPAAPKRLCEMARRLARSGTQRKVYGSESDLEGVS